MLKDEQVPGEEYPHGKRLRVYVVRCESLLDAAKVARPPRVYVSRTHPNLVRRLLSWKFRKSERGLWVLNPSLVNRVFVPKLP